MSNQKYLGFFWAPCNRLDPTSILVTVTCSSFTPRLIAIDPATFDTNSVSAANDAVVTFSGRLAKLNDTLDIIVYVVRISMSVDVVVLLLLLLVLVDVDVGAVDVVSSPMQ